MEKNFHVSRDENGIPHIESDDEVFIYEGIGYCHAVDRCLQLILMRIIGQGRTSEILDSSDEMLQIDKFFRRMNWCGEKEKLSSRAKKALDSYCKGVNEVLSCSYPFEFRLLGYKPEPWTPEDTILVSRMTGYLTLAQSQGDMERFFIEMVQAGVSKDMLDELFPGILGGLDIELVKKVQLQDRIVSSEILWNIAIPRMMASNNWVISGNRTASGKPILANDPHLEVNRLPNVWYEVVLKTKDRYAMGSSMPGLPGIVVGRTSDVAWGATYTFMDAIDSWIEECKDGKYLRGEEEWLSFHERKEVIKRKKKEPVEVVFYENEHGVLEGDPHKEGFYLTTSWTASKSGAVSVDSMLGMWDAQTVKEGMDAIGKLETAWNWVLADKQGNIGYQMSGLMPVRRDGVSGFIPLPGWDEQNDWKGFVDYESLPRCLNPEKGYFVTANQDLNVYGKKNPINMPMGTYRADRISNLIEAGENFTSEDMFKIHFDVYSVQAEAYMKILKPLLPDTKNGNILKNWDLCYSKESEGAYLFELFFKGLLQEVFGKNGIGENVTNFLSKETGIFVDFYDNFDKILLKENSLWFLGEKRESIYSRVVEQTLKNATPIKLKDVQQVILKNILFGGKFPMFLGFDRGPVVLAGGRATVHQGQIYKSAGRMTSFSPSMRLVTDFSKDEIYTNMAGGPSDRFLLKWYCSDLKNWLTCQYKKITPQIQGEKIPFDGLFSWFIEFFMKW